MNPSSLFAAVPIKVLALLLPSLMNQSGSEWKAQAPGVSISFSHRMGRCDSTSATAAWSDLGRNRISLNGRCAWTPELLRIAVLHEYGHMLMGVAHSDDPDSVMFPQLAYGQKIQPADLTRATGAKAK